MEILSCKHRKVEIASLDQNSGWSSSVSSFQQCQYLMPLRQKCLAGNDEAVSTQLDSQTPYKIFNYYFVASTSYKKILFVHKYVYVNVSAC